MKLYISGPMSIVGPPTWNHPAFNDLAEQLRNRGYDVVNPAELDDKSKAGWDGYPWAHYLRRDIIELCHCDAIILLPGFYKSKGALLELHVAQQLSMNVYYPEDHHELLGKGCPPEPEAQP